jgi:dGTPase
VQRGDRQHPDKPPGARSFGQRDRDRVLYSSAFRRLAGVTQVVLPAGEPHLFHNRLVHSVKVAQIGQRLAQSLGSALGPEGLVELPGGGLDPDVVEAAALAHDLGHPPFGHVAEQELDKCVRRAGNDDGFEGNAQTFRIVTRLAAISDQWGGLNLSRATLAAIQKYPWFHGEGPTPKKWGAYREDAEDFEFMRTGSPSGERTIEADVMDWADDIAYAVHDLEDFYRAGLIPLDRIASKAEDLSPIREQVVSDWPGYTGEKVPEKQELDAAQLNLRDFPSKVPFRGRRTERADLRSFTSAMVNLLVTGTEISDGRPRPTRGARITAEFLKQLTRYYVIDGPALQTQQQGQRRIIRALFAIYLRALRSRKPDILPTRWREEADQVLGIGSGAERLTADIIASLTEEEAVGLHHRLTGIAPGKFLDPVVS